MSNNVSPASGWYPNPTGHGQRYWNGYAWTQATRNEYGTVPMFTTGGTPNVQLPRKTWTGANTMLIILASALVLLSPISLGVWGILLAVVVGIGTVMSITKDRKMVLAGERRGYWTEPRGMLAAVLFATLIFPPAILALPFAVAGVIYFIVSGISYANGKGSK